MCRSLVVQLQRPQYRLSEQSWIFRRLPVVLKVQAAETERAAAVRALPAPSDGFRLAVDRGCEHGLNRAGRRGEFEFVVEFVANAKVGEPRRDRAGAGNVQRGFDNLVLA